MQLLTALVEAPRADWGVRELASALHASPSTMHRLLTNLTDLGLVQSSDGRYRAGAEFRRLARLALAATSLDAVARPHLHALVTATDESAIVGELDRPGLRYSLVLTVGSSQPLQYVQSLHQRLPLHVGAVGIAITAALPRTIRRRYLEGADLSAVTTQTPTTPEQVEAACATAARRGFALTHGHKLPGAVGIAAPVFSSLDGTAAVLGAVSLTIPEQRFRESDTQPLGSQVRRTAAAISAELGVETAPDPW